MKFGQALIYAPFALLFVPFFVAPMIIIVSYSVGGPHGWFAEYLEIVSNQGIRAVIYNTFYAATVTTSLSILIGFPCALVLTILPRKYAGVGLVLVLLPFWTSAVIKSFAWMTILGRNGPVNAGLVGMGVINEPIRFLDNGVGMIIAMVYIMLPFAIMPIYNALGTIDETLKRAAAVLGANPLRQFLVVTLPLSLPGVAVGATIVFVVSLGFFVTPSLLGGSRVMISILISDQANRLLNWPLASALAVVLLAFTAALFGMLRLVQQLSTTAFALRNGRRM